MMYPGKNIWNKKLPAFAGVFILLFTLGLTVLLSRNAVQTVTKATIDSVPKNVQVSNISDTSFTVSYVTDASTISTIAYGKDVSMGEVTLDVRDAQIGKATEHRVHFMTVDKLEPATKYYFSITSGAQVTTNNGAPFEVTTATTTSSPPPANNVLTGSATLDDGSFPSEAIVYVSSENSQLLAALLQPNGSYSLPLTHLRTKDLSTFLSLTPQTQLKLQITNGPLQSDSVLLADQTDVPQMILSKNYDFALNDDPLDSSVASSSGETASQSAGFPIFDEPVAVNSPTIITPEEKEQFKDQQPLFKGRALPNTGIEIVINSGKEITASLQSDSTGSWEFRPPLALDPGVHTITISSIDANGVLQKLSRSFTVNAAGSQFTEPSVSPIQLSPTEAPPITPTIPALPSPTASASPSPTPTAMPSPTIDPNAITPTRGPLSPTGSYTTAAGIITSILFLAGGVILFFSIAV